MEDTDIEMTKAYIPPVNSVRSNYLPNISYLLQGDSLGDFNVHNENWHCFHPYDQRGISIVDQID